MSEVITSEEYQALQKGKSRSVVSVQPQGDHAARLRGHLRAMGDYYDIPREKVEGYIRVIEYLGDESIAQHLERFARIVGIPEGPASFYIRQQQLSGMI